MSSSSQLSRVSWQPSQEANFQTASFGRPFSVTSHLPESEQTSDLRVGQHRAVDADEQLAVLAVPAQAHPAAHVALEGDPDTAGANAAADERHRRMPHHDLGAADEGERGHGVEPGARDELRHQTDATLPRLPPIVDGDEDFHPPVLPLLQLVDEEQLFVDELKQWEDKGMEVLVTVDYGRESWQGRVGLVTRLIPRAGFDPMTTLALICGPEVMMRHTALALVGRGVRSSRIRVSLERNMRCGVGLCGHCQYRELFVCVDGPVLPYAQVTGLLGLREV